MAYRLSVIHDRDLLTLSLEGVWHRANSEEVMARLTEAVVDFVGDRLLLDLRGTSLMAGPGREIYVARVMAEAWRDHLKRVAVLGDVEGAGLCRQAEQTAMKAGLNVRFFMDEVAAQAFLEPELAEKNGG